MISNSRVLIAIMDVIFKTKDYKMLNDAIVALMKKHGLLKQAATKMIQHVVGFVEGVRVEETKLGLIDTLRLVMDGKVKILKV